MSPASGKTVLLTGAASGIGAAVARLCLSKGYRVAMVDRNRVALETLCRELGTNSLPIVADVAETGAAEIYVGQAMEAFGYLNAAVFNAGVTGTMAPLEKIGIEDFDQVIGVNLRGLWMGLRAVFGPMKAQGHGSIVLMSSTGGVTGAMYAAPYVASKHGVIGLMRAAALEGAKYGLRVNSVAPGPIETSMIKSIVSQLNPDKPKVAQNRLADRVPLGRLGTDQEVASMVSMLLGDDAKYCTGSVFAVDGGLTAGI